MTYPIQYSSFQLSSSFELSLPELNIYKLNTTNLSFGEGKTIDPYREIK